MHWQFRSLDPAGSLDIPVLTTVLAYRDTEQIIDYGNGHIGPERRLVVALDYFDGLGWQHEGSGQYLGYYSIPSVLQWQNGAVNPDARYLVRISSSKPTALGAYQSISKGIYLAKVSKQEHGLVWQCYQVGSRSQGNPQASRFISIPSNHVSHWQSLPALERHQWFR